MTGELPSAVEPHALIVGAGPGIGAAVARRFAHEGFALTLISRQPDRLDALAAELRDKGASVSTVAGDAADPAALSAELTRIARTAGPSVGVYNAAYLQPDNLLTSSPEHLAMAYRVNFIGAVLMAQALQPAMRQANSGTILFTGGSAGVRPNPAIATLSLGKAALIAATQMLAADLAPDGIHVATVTVSGAVRPHTEFDPNRIADVYWELHTQPQPSWEVVRAFDGTRTPSTLE